MFNVPAMCARVTARQSIVASVFFLAGLLPSPLRAESDSPQIVRVEEDWELQVDAPDQPTAAPQVTCTISPNGDVQCLHATLELNHQSLPTFVPGGVQLQLWDGESAISSHKFPDDAVMSTEAEFVHWTQAVEINDGTVTFEVTNGSSTTWGTFGGQGYLKARSSTTLSDLSSYDPAVSTKHSGVGYAANRVKHLELKRIRKFADDGTVYTDTTSRVVYHRD